MGTALPHGGGEAILETSLMTMAMVAAAEEVEMVHIVYDYTDVVALILQVVGTTPVGDCAGNCLDSRYAGWGDCETLAGVRDENLAFSTIMATKKVVMSGAVCVFYQTCAGHRDVEALLKFQ